MCGIIGTVSSDRANGNEEVKRDVARLAAALIVEAQKRGAHATGFVRADSSGDNVAIRKSSKSASDFVKTRPWRSLERNVPSVLIGHTRHTTGTSPRIMSNNHPFIGKVQPWVMVHNGWLINEEEEREGLLSMGREFDSLTDSEVILRLAEEAEDVLTGAQNTLATLRGPQAVALLEHDSRKTRAAVYLWTNGGNPLWIGRLKRLPGVVFFASTETIMGAAITKAFGTRVLTGWNATKIKRGEVYKLQPNKVSVAVTLCLRLQNEDIAHEIGARRRGRIVCETASDIRGITERLDRERKARERMIAKWIGKKNKGASAKAARSAFEGEELIDADGFEGVREIDETEAFGARDDSCGIGSFRGEDRDNISESNQVEIFEAWQARRNEAHHVRRIASGVTGKGLEKIRKEAKSDD